MCYLSNGELFRFTLFLLQVCMHLSRYSSVYLSYIGLFHIPLFYWLLRWFSFPISFSAYSSLIGWNGFSGFHEMYANVQLAEHVLVFCVCLHLCMESRRYFNVCVILSRLSIHPSIYPSIHPSIHAISQTFANRLRFLCLFSKHFLFFILKLETPQISI